MKIDPNLKEDLKKYIQERMHESKKNVTVISAYHLDQKEMDLLKKQLPFIENANIHNVIDKGIIAGLIIKFGTKMIDLSLRNELYQLKQTIYGIT